MPPADKTKEDRLKETIRLLKELQRVGIHETDPGYKEIQGLMTKWVADGAFAKASVDFIRYERRAEVELPKHADKAASIRLKGYPPIA